MSDFDPTGWVQNQIETGTADLRTHTHSSVTASVLLRATPSQHDSVTRALVKEIGSREWTTTQQVENACILAVNLHHEPSVRALLKAMDGLPDRLVIHSELVIAAARTYPGDVESTLVPMLLRWMRDDVLASRTFETLCEIDPANIDAYFSALLSRHARDARTLRKAVAFVLHLDGNLDVGAGYVRGALESSRDLYDLLRDEVATSRYVPENRRAELLGDSAGGPPQETLEFRFADAATYALLNSRLASGAVPLGIGAGAAP